MAHAARQLRQAFALVRAALEGLDPSSPDEVAAAAPLFAACAKLASAGALVCTGMLGDAGARRAGATSQAALLAQWSGTSLAKARRGLGTVAELEGAPAAHAALCNGELSVDQAEAMAPVLRLAPTQAPRLVTAARGVSLRGLKEEVQRTRARLVGDEALHDVERALHARRYCRLFPVDGGIRIDALLAGADAAVLRVALGAETTRLWRRTREEGAEASSDRLRADALVNLVRGGGGRGALPHVLVHVDAAALRRGEVRGDERCELPGVGPVSVRTARQLLGEGFFSILVADGVDIKTVTSMTRTIPRRLRIALSARDPRCVVPGCDATDFLEIDHWQRDFAEFGPTELDNLCRVCSRHHKMKTRTGWRLVGGPGRWRWLAPRRPLGPTPPPAAARSPAGPGRSPRGAGALPRDRHRGASRARDGP